MLIGRILRGVEERVCISRKLNRLRPHARVLILPDYRCKGLTIQGARGDRARADRRVRVLPFRFKEVAQFHRCGRINGNFRPFRLGSPNNGTGSS